MSRRISRAGRVSPNGRRSLAVAYLTNQLPFPPHSGGQLREAETLRRLGARACIDFFAVTRFFDRDVSYLDSALEHCHSITLCEAVPCDERRHARCPRRVRDYYCPQMAAELSAHRHHRRWDLLHVEGYFLMNHVPASLAIPLLLVEENIEYLLDFDRQQLVPRESEPSWQKSVDLEAQAWRRATICGVVTDADAEEMRRVLPSKEVRTLYPGCDHLADELVFYESSDDRSDGRLLVYVGNYSWSPSRDAAMYLLQDIWPMIRNAVPDVRLLLAGAGACQELYALATQDTRVELSGAVASIAPILARADVVISPIRFGGGVRAKILESLYAGKPIVSTSVGAKGLPEEVKSAIVIRDDPRLLAWEVSRLLMSPTRRQELGRRAKAGSHLLPSWSAFADAVWNAWLETAAEAKTMQSKADSVRPT